MYRAIVADPPWMFDDRGSRATPTYPLMPTRDICALEVGELAMPDSLLLLWVPSAMIFDGLAVTEAWGFKLKQTVIWRKTTERHGRVHIGMGKYFRNAHEVALLSARGKASRLIKDHSIPSIFDAPRTRHSAKPEVFQDLIERLIDGPYLELFGRRQRAGWTVIGNEIED